MCHVWGRIDRWEKQTESRLLLWAAVQPASLQQCISQWNRLQGIHTSVFPQMCPGLLITVVSVFELDLFGFIYMIMIPLLLGVNDVCFPSRFHQAVMLHRLCLNVSGCFYMLTCYCWLGFAMKAFWIIETTPFPQQPQPHTYLLRWRIFLCTRRKNIPIYVLCRLHLFWMYFSISGFFHLV